MILEYDEGRQWIIESFDCDTNPIDQSNSHFEMTIRILGGLLSIYHLTNDDVFLRQAVRNSIQIDLSIYHQFYRFD